MTNISIDSEIFFNDWNAINQIGLNRETNGINRLGYSTEDFQARNWFLDKAKEYGFKVSTDSVGNVFARFGPDDGPCIVSGSHIDSVPEGGKYDGILGVMAALECCRAMKAADIKPNIAIEIVGTAEEEGRFGGMLGSEVLCKSCDKDELLKRKDNNGIFLKDAMKFQNLDIEEYYKCKRNNDITHFIELHIEQGPLLERSNKKLGIVTGISGTMNPIYCLKGEANHSGTTPMELRKDPILAFSYIGSKVESIINDYGSKNARITIGHVDVEPNFAHTIPGIVRFTMNIRDDDNIKINEMSKQVELLVEEATSKYNCEYSRDDSLGSLSAVTLDTTLIKTLTEEAEKLEHQVINGTYYINNFNKPERKHITGFANGDNNGDKISPQDGLIQIMSSGAGHDAQNFQEICPSAMIFIPSINGISHAPEEKTEWDDCLLGAQLLCNCLYRLCMQEKS